jgi:hypothetical protein
VLYVATGGNGNNVIKNIIANNDGHFTAAYFINIAAYALCVIIAAVQIVISVIIRKNFQSDFARRHIEIMV